MRRPQFFAKYTAAPRRAEGTRIGERRFEFRLVAKLRGKGRQWRRPKVRSLRKPCRVLNYSHPTCRRRDDFRVAVHAASAPGASR